MKKALFILIVVVSGAVATGLVKSVDQNYFRSALAGGLNLRGATPNGEQKLEEALRINSLALNGTLPIRYESVTLLNTKAEGTRLTYFYRFNDPALPGDVKRFVEANRVQIRTSSCNDDAFYHLLSEGAEIVYNYTGSFDLGGVPVSIVLENCALLRNDASEVISDEQPNPYSGLSSVPFSLGSPVID